MTARKPVCDDCGASGEVRAQWNFELGEVRSVCDECGDGEPYAAPVWFDCGEPLAELDEQEEEHE